MLFDLKLPVIAAKTVPWCVDCFVTREIMACILSDTRMIMVTHLSDMIHLLHPAMETLT